MAVDAHETVWLNDLHRGVLKWANGRVTALEHLGRETALFLFRAHDDRIWIGFAGGTVGVLSVDDHFVTYDHVGLGGGVSAIAEDPDGVLWLAGADGIARFDNGKSVAATPANGFPGAGGEVSIQGFLYHPRHRPAA